jgi:MFS family permease
VITQKDLYSFVIIRAMSTLIPPKSKWVVPLISIVTFTGFLDTHLALPVIALYASSLGAGTGIIGIIIGLYSVTNTVSNVLFGRLVDRIGYKFPLLGGLMGDAVSMVLYTMCRLPLQLAAVRAVHGVSGGLVGPATMSAAANFSGKEKGKTMGIYGMSLAAATFIGFGLSGILAAKCGYKCVFLFGATLLLSGIIISLFLPKTKRKYTRELTTIDLTKIFILKRKELIIAYSGVFSQYFTLGGIVTLLPLYVAGLHLGAFHVGILLAIFSITSFVIQIPGGILSDNMGRISLIVVSLCLCAGSLIIIPFVVIFSLLVSAMVLYGIAHGFLFPSISALIADNANPGERGIATGIFHACITIGVAVGAPITGEIAQIMGTETGLIVIAVVPVCVLVITLIVQRNLKLFSPEGQ